MNMTNLNLMTNFNLRSNEMLYVKAFVLFYTILSITVWLGRLKRGERMSALGIFLQAIAITAFIVIQWLM